jgi:hypothetical protein
MGCGAPMCMRAGSDSACLLGTPRGDQCPGPLSGAQCRCHTGRARLVLRARMRVIATVPCRHRGPARAMRAAGCATGGSRGRWARVEGEGSDGHEEDETMREHPRRPCPLPATSLRASKVHKAVDGSPADRMTCASLGRNGQRGRY